MSSSTQRHPQLPSERFSQDSHSHALFRKKTTLRPQPAFSDRLIPYKDENLTRIAQFEINHQDDPLPSCFSTASTDLTFDEREEHEKRQLQIEQYDKALKDQIFLDEREISQIPFRSCMPEMIVPRLLKFKSLPVQKAQRKPNFVPLIQKRKSEIITRRQIPATAYKILDAPGIEDDYYLNLLDWSNLNMLAISRNGVVYQQNTETGETYSINLPQEYQDNTSSLAWNQHGWLIGLGMKNSAVLIYDVESQKLVREIANYHTDRVSSLAWNDNLIASGSKDSHIQMYALRIKTPICQLSSHRKEVCGLKWSPNGRQLASGSNDNTLCIWDVKSQTRQFEFKSHTAAVKALAWCPTQKNLLASGGGSKDRFIRIWNTETGECVSEKKTTSQVCSLVWSKFSKELVSSHGYEKNEISVWKYNAHKAEIEK